MPIINSKDVITKKPHNCFGCGRHFEKGSKLASITSVDGAEISTNYWCPVCVKYWDKYMDSDDEIGYGELKSNDIANWEDIRLKIEADKSEKIRTDK